MPVYERLFERNELSEGPNFIYLTFYYTDESTPKYFVPILF